MTDDPKPSLTPARLAELFANAEPVYEFVAQFTPEALIRLAREGGQLYIENAEEIRMADKPLPKHAYALGSGAILSDVSQMQPA